MSWTKDTKYPVLIRGYKIRANGRGYVRYVRFVLYSVPDGRKVPSTLAPGASKRIEVPTDGKDVWRTVTVYENGKIIHPRRPTTRTTRESPASRSSEPADLGNFAGALATEVAAVRSLRPAVSARRRSPRR